MDEVLKGSNASVRKIDFILIVVERTYAGK